MDQLNLKLVEKQDGVYPAMPVGRPVALVIHCGDPRFYEATKRFLIAELNLNEGQYVPLVPPGAIASLAEPDNLQAEFEYLKGVVGFYLGHFQSIGQVVLINHEDCAKYRTMHKAIGEGFIGSFRDIAHRQCCDLSAAAETILGLVEREIETHLFYARFTNPEMTEVTFERQENVI